MTKFYGSLPQSNKKYIDLHNEYADVHGYTLAMNEFGDLVSKL